ncbi:MAG TPA: TonB-dependent receptor plug domain-containing protein, partial [Bacteroidales bacterium]
MLLLLILFSCSIEFFGQEIVVNANNEPLNQVLTKIVEQYHINVSFDDKLLSKYKITQSATYSSPEDAVKSLIKNLPLEYENKDGVLIIYPKVQFPAKNKAYYLSGRVMDRISYEPLPYSHVIINGRGTVTDLAGSFAYSTTEDSIFSVKISHLGYYIVDTILQPGHDLQLLLTPSIVGLTEIEIKNELPETATQIGEQAGLMKLNNKIASFLPGFGDNSVFNLLRLQPGILASGEQTNELTIWGSYAGQSKVIFDGFTVYGLNNFNDNISAFNPMITKDMEVFKGGYDARLGERVGGIVNIT